MSSLAVVVIDGGIVKEASRNSNPVPLLADGDAEGGDRLGAGKHVGACVDSVRDVRPKFLGYNGIDDHQGCSSICLSD